MSKRAPRIKKSSKDTSERRKKPLKKVNSKKKDISKEKKVMEKKVMEKKVMETKTDVSENKKTIALVNRSGRITKSLRKGKGFSISELSKIDINIKDARKFGLRVDLRRNTELTHNIDILKNFIKNKSNSVSRVVNTGNKKNKEKISN